MRLLAQLLLRIAAVVVVCMVATTGWIMIKAERGIETAVATSVERGIRQLRSVYWQELLWRDAISRASLMPEPEWQSLATARVISPGVCLTFTQNANASRTLCSEAEGVYAPAPAWFAGLYHGVFGAFPISSRPLDPRQNAGQVTVSADPETALRLAWMQVGLMLEVASIMAAATGLLVSAFVTQALLPVRTIIDGLRQLELGHYAHRIGRGGMAELGRISAAVDDLAGRLGETQAARAALTRQLFQVQEDERRALARDLHDEFGQCLAATGALAASIQAGAADRPDLASDARAIGDVARRMMRTLKDALVRLRSQDIDDLGLEASLRQLVSRWGETARSGAAVQLDLIGDLDALPRPLAISLFRIAQECLTNAAKHGAARHVVLKVDAGNAEVVALSVEDDGNGDPARCGAGGGHGLVGIRERISALGGQLAIERAARGLRIAATIPFTAQPTAA